MNTRILVLICILLLWASCREGQEKEISLFNNYKFATDSSEHVADRDSLAQLPYTRYFNNIGQVQIPLYRIIEGEGYRIYLGIPFHTTLEKMVQFRSEKPMADSILQLRENAASFYRQFIKDSLYLTEYIRSLDSASLVCIYAVSTDSMLAATVLSEEKLKARMIK